MQNKMCVSQHQYYVFIIDPLALLYGNTLDLLPCCTYIAIATHMCNVFKNSSSSLYIHTQSQLHSIPSLHTSVTMASELYTAQVRQVLL